jgi:hypothetical protein
MRHLLVDLVPASAVKGAAGALRVGCTQMCCRLTSTLLVWAGSSFSGQYSGTQLHPQHHNTTQQSQTHNSSTQQQQLQGQQASLSLHPAPLPTAATAGTPGKLTALLMCSTTQNPGRSPYSETPMVSCQAQARAPRVQGSRVLRVCLGVQQTAAARV